MAEESSCGSRLLRVARLEDDLDARSFGLQGRTGTLANLPPPLARLGETPAIPRSRVR